MIGPTIDALELRLDPAPSVPSLVDVGLLMMDFRGLALSVVCVLWLLFFLGIEGRALPRDGVVILGRLRVVSLPLVVLVSAGFADVCAGNRLARDPASVASVEVLRGETICVGLIDPEDSDLCDCLDRRLAGTSVADELAVSKEDGALLSVIKSWKGERSKSC